MSSRLGTLDDTKSQDEIAELVRAAAQGHEPAWRALVDNFAGLVWSVIHGYRLSPADAADVSQTTWLRLAEHIASLRQPERVGAWLVTTAGRECLVLLRRSRRHVSLDDACFVEGPAPEPASQPEAQVMREEEEETLSGRSLLPCPDATRSYSGSCSPIPRRPIKRSPQPPACRWAASGPFVADALRSSVSVP